jgi:hypothetical protein
MKDITVDITDEDIDAALEEAKEFDDEPRAVSVERQMSLSFSSVRADGLLSHARSCRA